MLLTFLLIVQSVIAVSLIGVILMQRSEGGGLGVGGSSSGFMTARGAADFLTRATAVLGALFIILSIVMAAVAGVSRKPPTIDASLANRVQTSRPAPTPEPAQPAQQQPQNDQQPSVPLAQ